MAVCFDIAIGIILACDVYLPNLQVLKIWDLESMARSGQAKYGKQSQTSSVGSPQKRP
jgi:hypothetical protein